jgi:hypothetical protein
MKYWNIGNKLSGHHLGVYEAATAEAALDALARDAGYLSHLDACEQVGGAPDELVVTAVERAA